MNTKRLLSAIVVLALTSTASLAQEQRRAELYLHGGLSIPSQPSEFSDYWKLGFTAGGGLGYLVAPNFSVFGYFDYNNFSFDEQGFLNDTGFSGTGVSVSGASVTIITASGNLKVSIPTEGRSLSPYFVGGVGFFRISASDITVSGPGGSASAGGDSETAVSILFGAGIDIPAGTTTYVFIEARYGIGFTDVESTQYFPLKAGVKIKL